MTMAIGDEIIRERLDLREQTLSQQSDTLDVKASILLVAVTFLAGHSMYLLEKNIGQFIRYDQFLSVLLQVAAGITLAFHLRVRGYSGETSEELPEWRDEVVKAFGSLNVGQVEEALNEGLIKRAKERVKIAKEINDRKTGCLELAYKITLAAFVCNLAAAAALLL